MAKGMVWMWEYSIKELNEKGKEVMSSRMSLTPVENGKKIRVRFVGPKGKPTWNEE